MIMSMEKIYLGGEKRRKSIQELSRNDSFLSDVKKFRQKYKIPTDGYHYIEATANNINHKILVKDLTNRYAKKDINRIQKKYSINESKKDTLIDSLLFKVYGLSKRNYDIHSDNIPILLEPVVKGAEKLKARGKARLCLAINGTTKASDIKDTFKEELRDLLKYLPSHKKPFRVLKKNKEVLIEIFKNTRAYHFNKESWENLVIPKQKTLPDYDQEPFRKIKNNERDREVVNLLESNSANKTLDEIGDKTINDKSLSDTEKKLLSSNDYSYLYKIRNRYKKLKN